MPTDTFHNKVRKYITRDICRKAWNFRFESKPVPANNQNDSHHLYVWVEARGE